ncbi:MAG: 30S ribosomal protein S12 methylthiotransferase RimO [Bacteroidales bacterium]|nr:30S ribosomal protein S12 methylthiotransferase RimO [Bacteroidales bacterium]
MRKNEIDIITLGCSKNLVDSEKLLLQFKNNGYTVKHDPKRVVGEVVVVNTCGFIGDAKEESINTILELAEAKKNGQIGKLFVMGCLSERYRNELIQELPEVDGFYGKFDWPKLLVDLHKNFDKELLTQRVLTTPSHYAYVKIAEGCNRHCSYCAIPLMTGPHRSLSMEDVESEVRNLVKQGVREIQLLAQDLTFYGRDNYGGSKLAELVERIAAIDGVDWIRLHYAYPYQFPKDILAVMNDNPKVCAYLDMALQHISTHMLQLMRRHITSEETYALIQEIREKVPGIHLRTTLMVGHPGETEADFQELKTFVEKIRFERMGAFAYSHEEGTYAYQHYKDDVPEEVKQQRLNEIMALQEGIAAEINAQKVGKIFKVIVDREEGDYYVGRTEYDSPEVDCEVLISKNDGIVEIGQFYSVKVTEADVFDLYGKVTH